MEILFLNPFFYPYPGGTEKHLMEVGKRLAKKHDITILTAQLNGTSKEEEFFGMHIIREPTKVYYSAPHPIPPPVPNFLEHETYLKKALTHCELVHVHNRFIYHGDGKLIKSSNKKLCLTLHNARPENIDVFTNFFGSLFDDAIAKRFMLSCDGISAVSKATFTSTVPHNYIGKKAVIHNGVDEKLFLPKKDKKWKQGLKINKKMVLTNARLLPQKGIGYLIEAMQYVNNAELVVFGRGPLKSQLETYAKKLGAKAHFITEKIPDDNLVELYAASDCFVLPSLYEPCSVALIEAMSCGKPIVATDVGGNPDLIKDNVNGFIVKSRDAMSLAKKINLILNDKTLSRRFSKNNRAEVLKRLTWNRVAKELEIFYKNII